ncbi:hypothetical protein K4S71_09725 [Staphylococcus epidermidis]|nr:hypothetical protein [Staphylococcus epidermidis]MCG1591641.1 hypothetical protein [Staphylococcus epidermidis]MCG2478632.1 hypothetical protein [Staphylococcus epidermidis]
MKKVSKNFYLDKNVVKRLSEIKTDKKFGTNSQVIEFLLKNYDRKSESQISEEEFLKKQAYIDKQLQILIWLNSLLLNNFKVEPMKKSDFLYDYEKEAKNDVEEQNRITQIEFLNRM